MLCDLMTFDMLVLNKKDFHLHVILFSCSYSIILIELN